MVVLVAEDEYKENEADSVYDALRSIYPFRKDSNETVPKTGDKVIVGLIFLSLASNPDRIGQFNPEDAGTDLPKSYPKDLKRDQSNEALDIVGNTLHNAEERWFKDHMEITSICVHPAYWRSGHGEELAKWCTLFSDADGIPLCVAASPMGHKLFSKAGFEEREMVIIEGYDKHPDPIDNWFSQR